MAHRNDLSNVWGTCENSQCFNGTDLVVSLNKYVGKQTVKDLGSGCKCTGEKYGPYCSWNEPIYPPEENVCGHGGLNKENFLSGCECRNDEGKATAYHGWYCKTHNRVLCDTKSIHKGKFYDVNRMDKDVVGDCCSEVCRTCNQIFGGKCQEDRCQQDDDTDCKSSFRISISDYHFLKVYSKLISRLGDIICLECEEGSYNEDNDCLDECIVDGNIGCDDEKEKCEVEKIVLDDGTESQRAVCKSIPLSPCNDGNGPDCHDNGKCVQLPGNHNKSCLCKITHGGQFCENPRKCDNGEGFGNQNPCLNNGNCTMTGDETYKCDCEKGFYGANCEKAHPCHRLLVRV